ncbi:MAG TPA: SLC13 family permease, partial [Polyangiaceae bacterium]|nr:SLC13 family permease [Polyangiaceae bacterium]
LFGAVLFVAARVLTPGAALHAIDGSTLLLLFGMMGMGAFLAADGFFDQIEQRLVTWASSPARLLGAVVWGAGAASALITNDAVCVLAAPLIVRLIERRRLPALPFLLALASGANTGSVATLVGNPQNMLCGVLGGLRYREHLALLLPVAVLGLALNHALLWLLFRRELGQTASGAGERAASSGDAGAEVKPELSRRNRLTLLVIAASVAVYLFGGQLAWTAVGGFVALMLVHRPDTRALWPRVDWALLVFFSALFVVVQGLTESGAPQALFQRFPLAAGGAGAAFWLRLSAIFLVGSNLVSNVPFILVVRDQMSTLPNPRLGWELLSMASTFAGNLTLLGSVANIIVAEAGRSVGGIGFWQYLRLGLPLALVSTLLGSLWLLGMMHAW